MRTNARRTATRRTASRRAVARRIAVVSAAAAAPLAVAVPSASAQAPPPLHGRYAVVGQAVSGPSAAVLPILPTHLDATLVGFQITHASLPVRPVRVVFAAAGAPTLVATVTLTQVVPLTGSISGVTDTHLTASGAYEVGLSDLSIDGRLPATTAHAAPCAPSR